MTARQRANAVCIQTLNAGDEELAKAIEVAILERREADAKIADEIAENAGNVNMKSAAVEIAFLIRAT